MEQRDIQSLHYYFLQLVCRTATRYNLKLKEGISDIVIQVVPVVSQTGGGGGVQDEWKYGSYLYSLLVSNYRTFTRPAQWVTSAHPTGLGKKSFIAFQSKLESGSETDIQIFQSFCGIILRSESHHRKVHDRDTRNFCVAPQIIHYFGFLIRLFVYIQINLFFYI